MLFFGEKPPIARYDSPIYPWIEKLTRQQLGFFWQPEEVTLTRDPTDFKNLSPGEQSIITNNLLRQTVLDTVQGREPSLIFLPICSNPELESFIQTWAFFENIHSRSYTHILRAAFPNPSQIFDQVFNIEPIVELSKDINRYYDDLGSYNGPRGSRDHKILLWRCLNAVNALEGIRFYVSFACTWNFAENKVMVGNAKIVKLIARDENLHLAFTTQLLKQLVKDDPEFAEIRETYHDDTLRIFDDVVQQENHWAEYLFQNAATLGLSEKILKNYVHWIATKRLVALGYRSPYGSANQPNPLPWTVAWISSEAVQVAPQEDTKTEYIIGGIKADITDESFKDLRI